MKKHVFYLFAALMLCACGSDYQLKSPDGRIAVQLDAATLTYTMSYDDVVITAPAQLSLTFEDNTSWAGGKCKVARTSVNSVVHPVIGKNDEIPDIYNELELTYAGYKVILRAYNEGFAYRFVGLGDAADSLVVIAEQAEFRFLSDPSVIFGETANFTSWELSNKVYPSVSAIDSGKYAITPTVFVDSVAQLTFVVAEADLHAYPGMYLQKATDGLVGFWAKSPAKVVMGSWGNFVTVVAERENSIATVPANHAFPWRIIMPTDNDASLLNNELIFLLSEPCKMEDTSWIRAGKATWEWWHCAAPSTQLYKDYIDFAAENNIEYLLIDAGWNNLFRPTELNPKVDVHEILRYGEEKNVGVWLWMVASTLIHYPHQYLDSVSAWGAAGVKIDFFDRDDDLIMREYDELAKACAERHLLVDFHGCSKPTGLNRAYPNVLNYEAVRGQECAKWDTSTNPDYRMQFIFGRMLAGPMDYTPGSMRNCNMDKFKPIDPGLPFTMGTRCNEIAMYVCFDEYFAMLCDAPDEYRKYPDILSFLQRVPATWNETLPLDGRVGEKAVIAKRSGDTWYVGGMCGWCGAQTELDLSFLTAGVTYKAELFTDVPECKEDASLYSYTTTEMTAATRLPITMQSGGGFVLILTPETK